MEFRRGAAESRRTDPRKTRDRTFGGKRWTWEHTERVIKGPMATNDAHDYFDFALADSETAYIQLQNLGPAASYEIFGVCDGAGIDMDGRAPIVALTPITGNAFISVGYNGAVKSGADRYIIRITLTQVIIGPLNLPVNIAIRVHGKQGV